MASQRCDIQAGHGAVRQDMAWPAGSGGLCDAALKKKPERLLGTLRKLTQMMSPLQATIDFIAEQTANP